MKLNAERFWIARRKCFFSQYIFKLWNLLPAVVAKAANLDGFKKGLDTFTED